VIFSHHHPDDTLNGALFSLARFHDFWAGSLFAPAELVPAVS
jgi:hypothetical protein